VTLNDQRSQRVISFAMYMAAAMKAKQRLISDGGRSAQSYQQKGGGVRGHRKDWLRIEMRLDARRISGADEI
jgi:hypothetical protein